ncbi:MAG: hypothetical protein SGI92_02070 [Bryobacteraceae bacterium]|nr:hypothetical protein [Bryobacteraceae bacterium]
MDSVFEKDQIIAELQDRLDYLQRRQVLLEFRMLFLERRLTERTGGAEPELQQWVATMPDRQLREWSDAAEGLFEQSPRRN